MEPDYFINLIKSNTEETIHFVNAIEPQDFEKKIEGKWDILEILEHICITEKVLLRMLSKPPIAMAEMEEIIGNEKLKRAIVELRKRKIQAPELLHPKGRIRTKEDFEISFLEIRKDYQDGLLSGKITTGSGIHKHPFLGDMTMNDWLHFIPHHCQRHLEQITDIVKGEV